MTPLVAAASPTVAPAAPLAGVSTAVHDREWWAEEAVHSGTDWYGVVTAALEMMAAAGIIGEPAADTVTAWDTPSWRQAAAEYHRDQRGRLEPRRLERLHRVTSRRRFP